MSKETAKAAKALKKGGLILYPTDTVWGIGCDATDPEAVRKVYALKKRADSKALICLVSGFTMLKNYLEKVPAKAYDIIASATKPTTIIYNNPLGVARNLVAPDGSLGIRVANDEFCRELIETFGKPLVSTSANISGQPTPESFGEISEEILKGVDYVVNLYHNKKCGLPSAVVKLEKDGSLTVIRK